MIPSRPPRPDPTRSAAPDPSVVMILPDWAYLALILLAVFGAAIGMTALVASAFSLIRRILP